MSEVKRIYVSGPYTLDPEKCTRAAIHAGNVLLDAGFAPFVPHLSHFWHTLVGERHYEDWMRIDLAWASVCDVMLRLPGESSGADREVAMAEDAGISVFRGTAEEFCATWGSTAYG